MISRGTILEFIPKRILDIANTSKLSNQPVRLLNLCAIKNSDTISFRIKCCESEVKKKKNSLCEGEVHHVIELNRIIN